jgi:outer membrane protein
MRAVGPIGSLAALALCFGCAHNPPKVDGVRGASPSPATPWIPPPRHAGATQRTGPAVPVEQMQAKLDHLTLAEVVDITLQNNPATRAAWADAKAAAAGYGSAKGAYYPTVSVDGTLSRSNGSSVQGNSGSRASDASSSYTTVYGPTVSLSYLLLDFGGRAGDVEESKQALLAADWTHNAVLQNRVLTVEVAFYNYAGAKAILDANRASLAEADSSLMAAQERHEVGLATIADVLQAKTAYSQVKLDVQTTEGQVRTTRGALAVSMGYPANVPFDIEVHAPDIPPDAVAHDVEDLIDKAIASRPDLQAARATALEFDARVKRANSDRLPSLSLSGSAGWTWTQDVPNAYDRYAGALLLHVPLFTGFSRQYDLLQSKAEAEAAGERARGLEQQVIYEVFAAHSDFLTATERVATTNDLLASAQESEQVALGRYKEGVGDILDLLSAQRTLAVARAQQINARLGWFTALAQLARDTGLLGIHGENPIAPHILQPEVKP